MINWVWENKEWVFSGVGVLFVSGVIGFIAKNFRKKEPPALSQKSVGNLLNIQGAGDMTVGSIEVNSQKIPSVLAKPDFSITQVGFYGVSGQLPEFSFKVHNNGGECYRFVMRADTSTSIIRFAVVHRGRFEIVKMPVRFSSEKITITIEGLDENGSAYTQIFHGFHADGRFNFS